MTSNIIKRGRVVRCKMELRARAISRLLSARISRIVELNANSGPCSCRLVIRARTHTQLVSTFDPRPSIHPALAAAHFPHVCMEEPYIASVCACKASNETGAVTVDPWLPHWIALCSSHYHNSRIFHSTCAVQWIYVYWPSEKLVLLNLSSFVVANAVISGWQCSWREIQLL